MSSYQLNFKSILNNVLVQPLTQGAISHNITYKPEPQLQKPKERSRSPIPTKSSQEPDSPEVSREDFLASLNVENQKIYRNNEDEQIDNFPSIFGENRPVKQSETTDQSQQHLDSQLCDAISCYPHIFEKSSNLRNITKIETKKLLEEKKAILEELTHRVSNFSNVKQVINSKLKFLCQSNSHQFDTGMKSVRCIMTEMQDIRISLKNNKEQMKYYKKDISANMLKVGLLKIKAQRMEEIKEIFQKVVSKYDKEQTKVYQKINSCEYVSAFEHIKKCQMQLNKDFGKYGKVEKFQLAVIINQKFQKAEKAIWVLINQKMQKIAIGQNFERDIYAQIFEIYGKYSYHSKIDEKQPVEANSYLNMLFLHFKRAIEETTEQILQKYQKDFRRIQPQHINYMLKDLFSEFTQILYNHHLIVRFHMSADVIFGSSQFQLGLKQHITDHLLKKQRPAVVEHMDKIIKERVLISTSIHNMIDIFTMHQLFDFLNIFAVMIAIFQEQTTIKKPEAIIGNIQQVNRNTLRLSLLTKSDQFESLQTLSFIKQITSSYCEKFISQQFLDLRQMLENEDFQRLPLPKDYDVWRDNNESILHLYCNQEKLFENLEVYRSNYSKRPQYLAQMALSNPIKKMKFISSNQCQDELDLFNSEFENKQFQKQNQEFQELSEEFPFLSYPLTEQNLRKLEQSFHSSSDDPDLDEEDNFVKNDLIEKMQNNTSTRFGSKKDNYQQQLQSYASTIMRITSEHVIAISGINMVKSILLKHIELMSICQSQCFEIFVSFTNLMRFYTYVISNVFSSREIYELLMNDILMYGYVQEGNEQMIFTGQEKNRVNKIIQFQEKFSKLKEEMIDMQLYSDSSAESNLMNIIKSVFPTSMDQNHQLINIHKAIEDPGTRKIEIVVKSIIALQQIQYVGSAIEENNEESGFKRMMKHLIEGNTQHMTYMLNYFQQKEIVYKQVSCLIVRNNLKMLMFIAPPSSHSDPMNLVDLDANQKRKREFDSIITDQFYQIGESLKDTLSNLRFGIRWADMPSVKQEPSRYTIKIMDQIKQFEFKMQRICDHYHLPNQVLVQHLAELWELISMDLLEQYSLINEINENGRKTMYNDCCFLISYTKSPGMLILREYVLAYFYELPQLLQFSKEQIQENVSYSQLQRLYRVHPILNGQIEVGQQQPISESLFAPSETQTEEETEQGRPSFFKSWFTTEKKRLEKSQEVIDFYCNVDLFNEYYFTRGVRQESLANKYNVTRITFLSGGFLTENEEQENKMN